MTPQELKNSILQLAIQGKLVEQRPEEGTAQELYAQIQAERQRLVKEGKFKNKKKIEPITDEVIPFDIPDSWLWVRFGNLVNYSMGKTPPRAEQEWWGNDIPWVSIADMPESGHIGKTKECVSLAAITHKFGGKISRAGTLLMSFKLTVGRVSILDIDAVHNEAIISIYPFADDYAIEKEYLFYVLPVISQLGESKNAIKGKTLNDTSICNLLVPLPPLAEQKRIVAKIEELLPLVDRYEQAWTKLEDFNRRFPEDMKKSILQQAIQGKLVEQRPEEGTAKELYEQIQAKKRRLVKEGKIKKEKPLPEITEEEKPFEIPEGWMWVKLGNIVTVLGGKRIPAGRKLSTEDTGHKYIRVSDMKNGSVVTDNLLYIPADIYPSISKYIICKDDVYITVAGTIGRVGKIPKELDGANLTENADRLVFSNIDRDWLIQCLNSVLVQSQITEITTKVGQPKLAIKRIQELLIPLPPLAEQKRIVGRLEELLAMCERLKNDFLLWTSRI